MGAACISTILPNKLYLGNLAGSDDEPLMRKNDIKYIVNLSCQPNRLVKEGILKDVKVLRINIYDSSDVDIMKYFGQIKKFIDTANGNVLVHCQAGVSRSTTATISYVMADQRMNLRDAFKYVKAKHDKTDPNEGFVKQLIQYEKTLIEQGVLPKNTKCYQFIEHLVWNIRKCGYEDEAIPDEEIMQLLKEHGNQMIGVMNVLAVKYKGKRSHYAK